MVAIPSAVVIVAEVIGMLNTYSTNITVAADTAIPLNNIAYKKGNSVEPSGVSAIALNRCGVYRVACTASPATSTTIQLYRNGVPLPQAQGTGTNPAFVTFVGVEENNTCCPCTAPVVLQVMNTTEATFTDVAVTVDKVK